MNERSLDVLLDVPLRVSVELGTCRLSMGEITQLGAGSVVQMERSVSSPVDLLVNGTVVARGEIVAVDDRFALCVTEVV